MNFKQELDVHDYPSSVNEISSNSLGDMKFFMNDFMDIKDTKIWNPTFSNSLPWIKQEVGDIKTEQIDYQCFNCEKSSEVTPHTNAEMLELEQEEVDIKEDLNDNAHVHKQDIPTSLDTIAKTVALEKNQTESQQIFECAQCDYKTPSKASLKSHIKFHAKEKPFACTLCNYKTVDKSNLRSHLKVHSGEKSHKCTICEYKTTSKFALKQHVTIHTGEKLYKCELCNFSGGFYASFVIHMRTHSGEKPFKCTVCDYRVGAMSNLKNHMKIHSDERPYQCTQCEYKARVSFALKRHVKSMHSQEVNHTVVPQVKTERRDIPNVSTYYGHSVLPENINNCSDNEVPMECNEKFYVKDEESAFACKYLMREVCDLSRNKCSCHWCTV